MNNNIEELCNTNNWFTFKEFYKDIAAEKFNMLVEVGVWKGHSISYLANEMRELGHLDFELYAVDLFEHAEQFWQRENDKKIRDELTHIPQIYNRILEKTNTRELIKDISGISWEQAAQFEDGSIDFVYIDADHAYESVVKDITAWAPKVKPGGMISGHDYNREKPGKGVTRAVNELISNIEIAPGGVWYSEI